MKKWNLFAQSTSAKAAVDIRLRLVRRSLGEGGWILILGGVLAAAPLLADEATSPAVQASTAEIIPSIPAPAASTATPSVPATSVTPPPAASSLPGVMPKAPQSFLNEMTGTILSVDTDAGVVRITVQGGFNVDFSYDDSTQLTDDSKPIKPEDLNYGDKIVIRYAGRDLVARQIERTAQATSPIDTH